MNLIFCLIPFNFRNCELYYTQQNMKTMLPSSGERGNITWTLCQDPPLPLHSPPHPHSHSSSHYPVEKTSENAQLRYIYRCNLSMLMIYTQIPKWLQISIFILFIQEFNLYIYKSAQPTPVPNCSGIWFRQCKSIS